MDTLKGIFAEAWQSLRFHARRTLLTMLGIAWGIATVVMLLAYGSGFDTSVRSAFESFGTNLILIFPGRTSLQSGGEKAGKVIRLQRDDVEYLRATIPQIKDATPELSGDYRIAYGSRFQDFEVSGVYPVYGRIRKIDPAEGRWIGAGDEAEHARVAVIGYEVRKRLFSERPAVGEEIRVGGISFVVIGVTAKKIQDTDSPDNRHVFIPFSTMGLLRDTRYISSIVVVTESPELHEQVVRLIRARLGERLGFTATDKRALGIWDILKTMEEIHIITGSLKVLLAFIGALTLAIGGVGVMNIMLVSVMQRTREIGTQKSLGARRRHIMGQFLAEALLITFVGGVLGMLLAFAVSAALPSLPLWSAIYGDEYTENDIVMGVSWTTLLTSTAILTLVGLISGLVPAIRASRLDPVEALRYE
jgi:putative ABC transport system permease protein